MHILPKTRKAEGNTRSGRPKILSMTGEQYLKVMSLQNRIKHSKDLTQKTREMQVAFQLIHHHK